MTRRAAVAVVLGGLLGALLVVAPSGTAWAVSAPGTPVARAVPGNGYVVGAWAAPAANGSSITKYVVGARTYSATRKKWTAWSYTTVSATARSRKVVAANGTLVQVKVRAFNRIGGGRWSAAAQGRAGTPSAPRTTVTAGDARVTVTWSLPAANGSALTAYKVQTRAFVSGVWTSWTTRTRKATGRTMVYTGLVNQCSYQFRVAAANRYGYGPFGTVRTALPRDTTPPGPVSGLAVGTRTTSSIQLSWALPADLDLSGVVVRMAPGLTPPTSTSGVVLQSAVATSASASGLLPGAAYAFSVFTRDTAGNLGAARSVSTSTTATPVDGTPPGPVVGLAVGARTPSSIQLSWSNPADADLAAVVVRMAPGATAPTSTSGTVVQSTLATSAVATGLSAGTQYSFSVFSRDITGNLGAPASVTSTTTTPAGLQAISTRADGSFSPEPTFTSVWSPDGTKVVMYTQARLLPDSDPTLPNPGYDLYVKDVLTGAVALVSHRPDGMAGNGESNDARWSPDGTKIAFSSYSDNLLDVPQTTAHVYVYDLATQQVGRVSNAWDGSEPNGISFGATWSPDGQWIAFNSGASNLTATGDFNATYDVFAAHPDGTGTIVISKNMVSGAYANGASSAPVYAPTSPLRLMYTTSASNIVGGDGNSKLVVTDQTTGASVRVDETLLATGNSFVDSFQWSPDGTHVAFTSYATNLAQNDTNGGLDVFVMVPGDRDPVRVSQVSPTVGGDGQSQRPAWAGNGKIAFETVATNLTPDATAGRSKIVLADLASGTRTLVSATSDGTASADSQSFFATPNSDGTLVAFASTATNLVAGATGQQDVFVKDTVSGAVVRASQSVLGVGGNDVSATSYSVMSFSPVADELLFPSWASNLVAGDVTGTLDTFLWRA